MGSAKEFPTNRTSNLQLVFQIKGSAWGIPTNRTNRLQTILQTVHAALGIPTNRTNRYDWGGGKWTPRKWFVRFVGIP